MKNVFGATPTPWLAQALKMNLSRGRSNVATHMCSPNLGTLWKDRALQEIIHVMEINGFSEARSQKETAGAAVHLPLDEYPGLSKRRSVTAPTVGLYPLFAHPQWPRRQSAGAGYRRPACRKEDQGLKKKNVTFFR